MHKMLEPAHMSKHPSSKLLESCFPSWSPLPLPSTCKLPISAAEAKKKKKSPDGKKYQLQIQDLYKIP